MNAAELRPEMYRKQLLYVPEEGPRKPVLINTLGGD